MKSETMAEWTEEWGEGGMHGDAFLLFNLLRYLFGFFNNWRATWLKPDADSYSAAGRTFLAPRTQVYRGKRWESIFLWNAFVVVPLFHEILVNGIDKFYIPNSNPFSYCYF